MRDLRSLLGTSSRTLSYFLGGAVLLLAALRLGTSLDAGDIAEWAMRVFGPTFVVLLSVLSFLALFSWSRVLHERDRPMVRQLWMQTGMNAANGVATLALTYTLLGISLGIGDMAAQELTPATVQGVIRGLTEHFSMAFMTTVVGLPLSAVLRALLLVSNARLEARNAHGNALVRGVRP